ncbi:MAG: acetyl-CoA carboxylase carboxyl transferase subunit alpha, partial [Planctomycetota bacterium]|nr:acetyl-CoA carboxylase carboxyl transferase subunit alpha [Planctomycetota bacterium]
MSTTYTLPFEEPVVELERQIEALAAREDAESMADELESLRRNRESLLEKIYGQLTPWDTVRVARHPNRPQTADYINMICRDFRELHGDRTFGDDRSIITGFGRIGSFKAL